MMENKYMPIREVLNNFAGIVAFSGHQISQKCISRIKQQLMRKEQLRIEKRSSFLPKNDEQKAPLSQNNLRQNLGVQESRLAKINKIKEMRTNRLNQQLMKNTHPEINIDINKVMQYYAKEVRSQILTKYPGTPEQKIKNVTMTKWNSTNLEKKQAYINVVKKKILLQQMQTYKKHENHQVVQQNVEITNQDNEVKIQEGNEDHKQKEQSKPFDRYLQNLSKKKRKDALIYELAERINAQQYKEKQEINHQNNQYQDVFEKFEEQVNQKVQDQINQNQ